MNPIAQYDFKIPTFMLSYLINGEEDALTPDDLELCKKAEEHFDELKDKNGADYHVLDIGDADEDEDPYFDKKPNFCDKACIVINATLNIYKQETGGVR